MENMDGVDIIVLLQHMIEADDDRQFKLLLRFWKMTGRGDGWHPPQVWNDECDYGNQLLFKAIQHGASKCVDAMLTRMPFLNANKTGFEGLTPFCYAIAFQEYACAKIFLKHSKTRFINLGMPPPATDPTLTVHPLPPWIMAIDDEAPNDNLDFVRLLIAHRPAIDLNESIVNAEFADGGGTLHLIISKQHYDVALLLLATGDRVNVHALDLNGRTVLHCVANNPSGGHSLRIDVIKALLNAGVDKNIKDKAGKTAADYASLRCIRDVINTYVLLKKNDGVKTEVSSKKAVKSLELSSSSIVNVKTKSDTKSNTEQKKRVAEKENTSVKKPTKKKTAPIVSDSNNRRFLSTSSRTVCKSCHSTEALVDIQLQPCNHVVLCVKCRDEARKDKRFKCPACRQRVFLYQKINI